MDPTSSRSISRIRTSLTVSETSGNTTPALTGTRRWGAGGFPSTSFNIRAASASCQAGKVILGVNHEIRDFYTRRKKNLDLVIARPAAALRTSDTRALVEKWGIALDQQNSRSLRIPSARRGVVGAGSRPPEAKAAMTAHQKLVRGSTTS